MVGPTTLLSLTSDWVGRVSNLGPKRGRRFTMEVLTVVRKGIENPSHMNSYTSYIGGGNDAAK